jgi:hypothetical protein
MNWVIARFGAGRKLWLAFLAVLGLADILQRQGKTAEAEALRGEAAGATEKRAPDSQSQPENAQPKNDEGQGANGDIETFDRGGATSNSTLLAIKE